MRIKCLIKGHKIRKVDGRVQNLAHQKGVRECQFYHGILSFCVRSGCGWEKYKEPESRGRMDKLRRILIPSLFAVFLIGLAFAVPDRLSFQGRLTNERGTPISGYSTIEFDLFDHLQSGSSKWNSGEVTVESNSSGLFSTAIGPIPESILSGDGELFLQISIHAPGGPFILKPRKKLNSVAYSFYSNRAKMAENVMDGIIQSDHLQDGIILGKHVETGAIGGTHISSLAINETHLKNNTINSAHIQDKSVQSNDLSVGSVGAEHLKDLSVTGEKLGFGSVTSFSIKDKEIQGVDIASHTIYGFHIHDLAITTNHIEDGTILNRDLDASIISEDNLMDDIIGSNKIQNDSIQNRHIRGSISGSKISSQTIHGDKLMDDSISGTKIMDRQIVESKINHEIKLIKSIQSVSVARTFLVNVNPEHFMVDSEINPVDPTKSFALLKSYEGGGPHGGTYIRLKGFQLNIDSSTNLNFRFTLFSTKAHTVGYYEWVRASAIIIEFY